ncbi:MULTISPECIES: RidA family protein [unclassified Rhizobium]|uniref:RidA family protein n=1 Tax=unclassified Rhizobium TaxID=2613769 RepID=UPI001603751C|nr:MULTISPECIES: RidA family protein [unclassified Rhizobium]MBB1247602.1 RidA family protein [Rhizobium sp. G21]MCV3764130.1 RidA family protein [Rhizobium sp. TRM95796]
MANAIDAKLEELGVTLPQAAAPAANYVPFVQSGDQLFISGQLPLVDGKLSHTGQLGAGVMVSEAQEAAKNCAVNILAQAKAALGGDLSRITRVVRITCMVSSAPDFYEHHLVANGASNFLADVLGDAGKHARAAYGVAALPLNAAVEIDAILEVR